MVKRVNFVDKIIYLNLMIALLCIPLGGILQHLSNGFAFFSGTVWGSVNLFLLKHFLANLLLKKSHKKELLFLIFLKWPFLYLMGYTLLKIEYLSTFYLLLGFSFSISMLFLAGIYYSVLKSYEK